MKKLFISFILVMCFSLNVFNASSKNNCSEEIILENVNSNDLLNYIYDNHLLDKILRVCSKDLCSSLNATQIESDIKTFVNKNIRYLFGIDEEEGLNAQLKGFKIEKIVINSCV